MEDTPYGRSAGIYDLLYEAEGKDYATEAAALHELIQARNPGAASLLDVGCGTGVHLAHLRRHYEVTGVDLSAAMLAVARQRLPDVALIEGDMRGFDLGRPFDAITCLFSAIGYLRTLAELQAALRTFRRHLSPGGVVVVDGWVRRESWHEPGTVQALCAASDEIAVARVARSRRIGKRTTVYLHHVIASLDGFEHVAETHELTLFGDDDYRKAFERAGLAVEVVAGPDEARDRYVGTRAVNRSAPRADATRPPRARRSGTVRARRGAHRE